MYIIILRLLELLSSLLEASIVLSGLLLSFILLGSKIVDLGLELLSSL